MVLQNLQLFKVAISTVNYAAGKNLTVKQDINQSIAEQTYTYSLNSDLGGITYITNNGGPTMHFGGDNISITGGNLDLGGMQYLI